MHAVARAIHIAAKQKLVRLHQFRRLFCDDTAYRASEAPVAPQTADIKRVAQHRFDKLEPGVGPLPRIERNGDAALEQRFQCGLDKTLGAAIRRVTLAHDRKTHRQLRNAAAQVAPITSWASVSISAAERARSSTANTGEVSRTSPRCRNWVARARRSGPA